jgi:hypothetical protein
MKIFVLAAISVLVLSQASFSQKAFADTVVGRADFTTESDGNGPSGTIEIRDVNGQILGQGFSVGGGDGVINLTRTSVGVKGFSLNRFFNISCGADSCNDNGSANLNLALVRTATGFILDGVLNFVPVHAVVSATEISVSADSNFQLSANADGSFSGDGATNSGFISSYTALLTSSGSLQGLKEPAVFIATILNSAVR